MCGAQVCDKEVNNSASCLSAYRLFVAVFAVIVVPLSCVDLREQRLLQVIMAGARLFVVVTMVGTVLSALSCNDVAFDTAEGGPPHRRFTDIGYGHFGGLSVLVPTAVFART